MEHPQKGNLALTNPYLPAPQQKPKRAGRIILTVVGGIALFVAGIAVGASGSSNTPTTPAAAAATTKAQPPAEDKPATKPAAKPTKAAAPAKQTIEEGTWTVGEDFPAGTYKVTEAAGEECYWARKRSADGDIIANGLGGGKPKVTLKKGETFETSGCPPFVQQ
jgi:hypothetical protein